MNGLDIIVIFALMLGASILGNVIYWDILSPLRRIEIDDTADPDMAYSTRYEDEKDFLTPDGKYFTNKTLTSKEEDDDDDEEHVNRKKRR